MSNNRLIDRVASREMDRAVMSIEEAARRQASITGPRSADDDGYRTRCLPAIRPGTDGAIPGTRPDRIYT